MQFVTDLVFIVIFAVTAIEFAKHRDRSRLEIALMFGSLALIILEQGLSQLTGLRAREITLLSTLVILTQPFLLLRLVGHFSRVPWYQQVIGIIYLALSCAVMISSYFQGQLQPSPAVTLAIVIPFAYLEAYCAVSFVRAAARSRGMTHRRLVAAALGSGFLGAAIVVAGVMAFFPSQSPVVKVFSDLLALGSAVGYYIGFAPPAPVRRAWQMADLREFLTGLAGRSAEDRFTAALGRLAPAASHVVGGKGAVLFLGESHSATLQAYPDPENKAALLAAGLETIELGDDVPGLTEVWRERRAAVVPTPLRRGRQANESWGGAAKALVAPLIAHGELHGLLVVAMDASAVFLHEELELLNILADQGAAAIAGAQLMERLEQQNEALQAASRLKSEFLANMSHELRTPLNGIIGFSELMHDGKLGDVSEDQREYLGYILSSARHLLELINDVLDLSKVEAGKMEFRPETLRLPEVVASVLDSLRPLAAEKTIDVRTSCDGVDEVVLDEAKLKQVLFNFLSNALKFTPEGGRVSVLAQAEGDGLFRLAVKDTGIGISPEDVERLFVEFQQLDSASDKRYPGTGLGLALTKRIVESQGGHVGVTSVVGEGSTFYAVLPLRMRGTARHAADAVPALEPRAGASRVLVVEDEDSDRGWLIQTLAKAGYEVEAATSGAEAIERSRSERFDAITLDLLLPDMHGWEVLRSIRSEALNTDVPIIVVTVLADKTAAAGFAIHDFLPKPVKSEDLLAALQRAGVAAESSRPVLVVDDDPIALKLMETTLAQLGFASRCLVDPEQGLRAATETHPAAIVLDLLMPGIDGFEFLDRFRRSPAGRATPVLVWTNKDLLVEEQERLRSSAQAVVSKAGGGTRPLLEALETLLPARGAAEPRPA